MLARAGLDLVVEQVRAAHASRTPLVVRGGGSKDWYGEQPAGGPLARAGEVLDTQVLQGEALHEPSELVVTAPAGMRVVDLEARLAEANQCLAFEPPRFGDEATVGGMVACGFAGPARPRAGSLRDHLLGVSIVDGAGRLLQFGGTVIKNVAGYDVSRVVAGSLGILGVVVAASLKVLPRAPAEATLRFDWQPKAALDALQLWGGRPLPLDASAWWNGSLVVRLRGAPTAVDEAIVALGGERIDEPLAASFWQGLREQTDDFFVAAQEAIDHQGATLWRLSLPPAAPPLGLPGDELIEWHGGQRWLATALPAAQVREAAAAHGGHATVWRGRDRAAGTFAPLDAASRAIHERLKAAFDSQHILNRGRLYPDL